MPHRRLPLAALGLAVMASAITLGAAAQSPDAGAPAEAASPPAPAASLAPSAPASIPAGPTITVHARDYAFEGLPSSVPAGTSLAFQNDGAEVHELLVARRNDGVTETWDELLAMPDEQVGDKVTIYGPLLADPGEAGVNVDGSGATLVLPLEGDYLALCFVPQGMTEIPSGSAPPDPSASFGPPHVALGMRQAFTVTAPGTSPGPLPSAAPMASPAAPAASPAASPAG